MSKPSAIRVGDWIANRSTGELRRGSQTVHLEPRVMDVLFALAANPGRAVGLNQLMDSVWGDIAVTPESVYQAIAVLRKALANNSDQTEYIITVPKRGYRLAVPVTAVSLPEDETPPEAGSGRDEPAAGSMRRPLFLVSAGFLLLIIVLLARFLTSDPEANALPRNIVLVASDDVAGSLADRLVSRFLVSEGMRLLTPSVPMYAGPEMDEQVLMARTLDADFVVSLNHVGESQINLVVLDLASDEVAERQRMAIDFSRPEVAAKNAAEMVETIIGTLPVSGDDNPDSRRSISDAAQLEALGRYFMQRRFTEGEDPRAALDQARIAFRQAIEADRNFVPAWTGLGLSQVLASQYGPREEVTVYVTTGRAAIDKALAISSDSAEAYAALGLSAEFEGDYLAARAALERAVSLDPSDPMLMRWLAKLLFRLGYYRKAASLATEAAENAPFSPEILHSAGLHTHFAGNFYASITFSEAALDLEPGDLTEISNLFVTYREIGQLDKAIATGRFLLESSQSSSDESGSFGWAIGMVSDLYTDLGLPETARALAVRAEADYPATYETMKALFRLELADGDIGSVRQRFAYWEQLSDSAADTAEVAVNATVAGMDTLGLRLMESLPEVETLADGMNPMLETGRWLRTDYLYFASLPAVYRALLHLRHGEEDEARQILTEAERFLDYWIQQGLKPASCLYLRAIVHAMQKETDAGLEALLAAVESGWRDSWRIRHDPALYSLKTHPGYAHVLSRLDEILATQRQNVITSERQIARHGESRPAK